MLKTICKNRDFSLYEIQDKKPVRVKRMILSTPETRAICNNPFVMGINYTRKLQEACKKAIQNLQNEQLIALEEKETIVFNILRGGLNFGLREAISDAFDWNRVGTSFISAQRARVCKDSENWHIIESDYKKVYMPKVAQIVIGDVVATGTSLHHGLKALIEQAEVNNTHLKSILFFTIGAPKTEEILENIDKLCRESFKEYVGTTLCYVEGRFEVPTAETPLTVKLTGTDLLRRGALMSPDFIISQTENPTYPIERCTIYDAGSRAFWLPEYITDVIGYWQKNKKLAEQGMTYKALLDERFPSLVFPDAEQQNLAALCDKMIGKMKELL